MAKIVMKIASIEDIDVARARILLASALARKSIVQETVDELVWLQNIKFTKIGIHPYEHRPLNFIEQVNQTFSYLVALEAARMLLTRHPECGGLNLAPGAHASQEANILGVIPGVVCAECFAATSPKSNNKLNLDLKKLQHRSETHKYIFFSLPLYLVTGHRSELDKHGIEVWSVKV